MRVRVRVGANHLLDASAAELRARLLLVQARHARAARACSSAATSMRACWRAALRTSFLRSTLVRVRVRVRVRACGEGLRNEGEGVGWGYDWR